MPSRRRSKQKKKKKKKMTSKLNYLPAELIEQILLKLPVKSLLRFSTASKLWNSIIFRPGFAQSYRGREMIVFKSMRRDDDGYLIDNPPLVCPLSSMSSDNPTEGTTPFDFPFDFPPGSFIASCGYLWCFKFENSLLLYNPTIQTYRKLPNSELETDRIYRYEEPVYVYGLGYDSVCDDYKFLEIQKSVYDEYDLEIKMYSLRSNCWRKVENSQPPQFSFFVLSKKGLFVSGKIHWLIERTLGIEYGGECIDYKLLSFDLSEEKFGLIELPEELTLPKPDFIRSQFLDMIVLGGKLCVYLRRDNLTLDRKFGVWVMEDYESKLWTKEMDFDYGHMPRLCFLHLIPFYFYDGAGNLVRAITSLAQEKMFIYKEEEEEEEEAGSSSSTPTLVEKNFGSNGFFLIDSFTYVESFGSHLPWHGSSRKAYDDDDGISRNMEELKLSS